MGTTAILTGTGLLNEDGSSRSRAIRRHCEIGRELELRRDESPLAESSGVAVFVRVPRFFGLLGHSHRKIGFVDPVAAAMVASRFACGEDVRARVKSVYAPIEKDQPRVTLSLDD